MPNKNLIGSSSHTVSECPLRPVHSVFYWLFQVGDNSKVESALYLPNQKWCGASLSIFCFLKLKVWNSCNLSSWNRGRAQESWRTSSERLALCLLNSHRILHFLPLPFLAVDIKIYFKFSHFRVSLASYKCFTIKIYIKLNIYSWVLKEADFPAMSPVGGQVEGWQTPSCPWPAVFPYDKDHIFWALNQDVWSDKYFLSQVLTYFYIKAFRDIKSHDF